MSATEEELRAACAEGLENFGWQYGFVAALCAIEERREGDCVSFAMTTPNGRKVRMGYRVPPPSPATWHSEVNKDRTGAEEATR